VVPDPTFQPDADPDLDPSFQIKAQTLENDILACYLQTDADLAYLFDADPDPDFYLRRSMRVRIRIQSDADPDPDHNSQPSTSKILATEQCRLILTVEYRYGTLSGCFLYCTVWSRGFRTLWIYAFFRF
jgi:hypothetical protein